MNKIIPKKLQKGDEIRVISPSRNMSILGKDTIDIATSVLNEMGFNVTFGKNSYNLLYEEYGCASIDDRIEDLHEAIKDENVKAILTSIGGFNSNQILDYIDYDLIKNNPKIICGYSDITALLDSITAKTGLVTYYGPHFSTLGIKYGNEYTIDHFKKMLLCDGEDDIVSSEKWSNDLWFLDQEKREFLENEGMTIINTGSGEGTIIGGNLNTLNLLQGSKYMPTSDKVVLFIEDDGLNSNVFIQEFDRNLQSLIHAIGCDKIKGIVVGRAEINCNMTVDKWRKIFETKKELIDIPIVVNADFGHTNPMITIPIGGYAKMNVQEGKIEININEGEK